MNDISLDQIEGVKTYNFITKYDEDNDFFSQNMHSCKYYEMEEFKKKFSKESSNTVVPIVVFGVIVINDQISLWKNND